MSGGLGAANTVRPDAPEAPAVSDLRADTSESRRSKPICELSSMGFLSEIGKERKRAAIVPFAIVRTNRGRFFIDTTTSRSAARYNYITRDFQDRGLRPNILIGAARL